MLPKASQQAVLHMRSITLSSLSKACRHASRVLHYLKRETSGGPRPILIIHGPYASGKSSMLRYIVKHLRDEENVCFLDASLNPFAEDMTPNEFWAKMCRFWGIKDTLGHCGEVVEYLRNNYVSGSKRLFIIMDELPAFMHLSVVRQELSKFLRLVHGVGFINEFYGGFVGTGTYLTRALLNSPEVIPSTTPQLATPKQAGKSTVLEHSRLKYALSTLPGEKSALRSPFQRAVYVLIEPLKVEQTIAFIQSIEKEFQNSAPIEDELKTDIHYFAGGNIGMITTCASVLFSCPSPDMAFWEEAKLKRLPNQLRSTNRMVIRILEALDAADDEMKRFIVRLLHAEAPFYVNDFDRQHAGILLDAGVAKEESGQISIASPYLKTLLLNVVYPDKVITDHEPLPLAPDGSIDLIALVRSSLKYVGAKIGWSKLSANRPGPAEAVIHAELYAALRAIGRKKNMFLTHVEVKQQPGVEQRLDLLLTAQDSPDNFAGFELKVNKLKRSDIINVVERQAERYRQFHSIANMFVVNFVSREHQMDHDMPDQVGAVHCLYVRFDAGFSNVVVTRGNGAPYQ